MASLNYEAPGEWPAKDKENSPEDSSRNALGMIVVSGGAAEDVLDAAKRQYHRDPLAPSRVQPLPTSQFLPAPPTPTVTLNSKKHLSAPSPIDTGIEDDMRDDGEDNIFLESIRLLDDMRRKSVQSLAHVRTPPNRYRQRIKQTNENSGLQAPKTSPATDTTITEGALSPEWEPFPSTPSEQALNQQGAATGNAPHGLVNLDSLESTDEIVDDWPAISAENTPDIKQAVQEDIGTGIDVKEPSLSMEEPENITDEKGVEAKEKNREQESEEATRDGRRSGSPDASQSSTDSEAEREEEDHKDGVIGDDALDGSNNAADANDAMLEMGSPKPSTNREKSLRKRLKEKELLCQMLTKQLESHGDSAITEVVSLEEAQKKLRKALEILMNGEDASGEAEKDFEKWDKFIRNHPEHIAEQKRILAKWDEDNAEVNATKLKVMRTFVPPDVWSSSQARLSEAGLSKATAKRIWSKKVLWLTRAEKSFMARLHAADLNLTYSIQGLDLVELRAVWACLPATFENDGDDRKAAWKEKVLTRLKEMVTQEEAGSLSKAQKRAACYNAESVETGPFDPDAPLVPVAAMQGNAFKQGVDAEELQKLCSTGGGLASRRSSLATAKGIFADESGAVVATSNTGLTAEGIKSTEASNLFATADSVPKPLPKKLSRRFGAAFEKNTSGNENNSFMAELTSRLKEKSKVTDDSTTKPKVTSQSQKTNPIFAELAGRYEKKEGQFSPGSKNIPRIKEEIKSNSPAPTNAIASSPGVFSSPASSSPRTTSQRIFGRLPRGHTYAAESPSPTQTVPIEYSTPQSPLSQGSNASPSRGMQDSQKAHEILATIRSKQSPSTLSPLSATSVSCSLSFPIMSTTSPNSNSTTMESTGSRNVMEVGAERSERFAEVL